MPAPVEIRETELDGVLEIEAKIFADNRGFFTETYNQETWAARGFNETFVQDNLSMSKAGTLRGMHYQIHPHAMGKLVRVISGAVFDVAVDLREESPTFGQWIGRELTGQNGLMLWIPEGFAHGFLALRDDTLVYYKCTGGHAPQSERALRHDDPEIGIVWPATPSIISPKDADAPALSDAEYNFRYEG